MATNRPRWGGVTAGKLTFSISANGVMTSLSLNGHVLVDVCAALS
jgi:hypothetical protein